MLQKWFSGVIREIIKPEVVAITKGFSEQVMRAAQMGGKAIEQSNVAIAEVRELRSQLSALLALDVDLKGQGKAIILTRVQGQDRCKIIDLPREMTLADYKNTVDGLKSMYGAELKFVDAPREIRENENLFQTIGK
jgi:hypothetical protein